MALYLIPFFAVEPELAAEETRVLTLFQSQRGIPPGSYGLLESYCPDPTCDCRRVMLNVAEEQQPERFLASISYGFDRDAPEAGPFLDPFNEQSPYAQALLELINEIVLSDAAYLARLERHYHLVKAAAEDPTHLAHQIIRQALERELETPGEVLNATGAERIRPATSAPKVGRNEPCPCGSGKKYKYCCGRRR